MFIFDVEFVDKDLRSSCIYHFLFLSIQYSIQTDFSRVLDIEFVHILIMSSLSLYLSLSLLFVTKAKSSGGTVGFTERSSLLRLEV